ncbi:MAG: carboxymuconolactone decarboxylase family protein [Gemmatirosa sp.]
MSAREIGAARREDPTRVDAVGSGPEDEAMFGALDAPTRVLVRLAAVIAAGDEAAMRVALTEAARTVPPEWVEELILQSYLFAGFPRTLNAMREWRRASGRKAPADDPGAHVDQAAAWAADGEDTCARVYGPFYERLRPNIAALHPALDMWMIVDGYGKVLSRPGLDLVRRELCVIAVCAVARQDRQLHSHLHGALHVGASPQLVEGALDALADMMTPTDHAHALRLWSHVRATQHAS